MAKLVLTKTWVTVPVSNGTIENDSIDKIEIAPLSEDHGLFLYPKEKYQFGVALKARSTTYNDVTVNVVSIAQAVPGSDEGTASSEDIDSLFTKGTSSGSQQSGGQSAGSDTSDYEASKNDIDSLFNF